MPPLPPLRPRNGTPARAGRSAGDVIMGKVQEPDVQAMMLGRVVDFDGQLEVEGTGELTHPLWFPGRYVERPLVLSGGEIVKPAATPLLEYLEGGSYPTVSVMVGEWFRERTGTIDAYVGASLVIVITGQAGQLTRVHFRITGKAIRGPVGSADTDTPN